jgi:hypothetical protein
MPIIIKENRAQPQLAKAVGMLEPETVLTLSLKGENNVKKLR